MPRTLNLFALLAATAAVASLTGCATAVDSQDDDEGDLGSAGSAFVSQSQVPGTYHADTKNLRKLNCGGGYCGVSTSTVAATASFLVNADNTWSCSGTGCTFTGPTGNVTLTSGTWAFPPVGDWRFIALSTAGTQVATAKVGEWYTPGQATLTISLTSPPPQNVTGTYTSSVHFVHD